MGEKDKAYERDQLASIEAWEREGPSSMTKTVGFFATPLALIAKQVVPVATMEHALEAAFDVAHSLSGIDDILAEAAKLGHQITGVTELAKVPLYVNDSLSKHASLWAKGLAAAEGAVTGMAGLPGLAADIPALAVLTIRAIRRIGFCYGFDTNSEAEKAFLIHVLSAGAANSSCEKTGAIHAAMEVHKKIISTNAPSMPEGCGIDILTREGFSAAIRNLAKQLCINLSCKVVQSLPLVGGGVGAVLNTIFLDEVTQSAIRLYQKRKLYRLRIGSTESRD